MAARSRSWMGMWLVVSVALMGACGGGGSSDGGVVDPGPTLIADFIPAESLPPSESDP